MKEKERGHIVKCSCNSHGSFLTAKGLKEAAQRESALLEVDAMDASRYLDIPVSVSGLFEFEFNDEILDNQYRRFLNGS